MTTYRLYPSTNGPSTQAADAANYTLATEFYVTSAAWLTKIYFWCSTTLTGSNHVSRLYSVDAAGTTGTLVTGTSMALPSPLTAGWNVVTLPTAIALTANQHYRVAVFFTTDNGYTATANYWTTGGPGASQISNGPLIAPSRAGTPAALGNRQGSLNSGADAFPATGSGSSGNYWLDVEVTDTDPGASAPTVDAGADTVGQTGSVLVRTALEVAGGATITARAWTILSGPAGVGTTIGTAASLNWTPSVAGTFVLRYTATNSVGSGSDDVQVVVSNPPPVPGQAFGLGFFAA